MAQVKKYYPERTKRCFSCGETVSSQINDLDCPKHLQNMKVVKTFFKKVEDEIKPVVDAIREGIARDWAEMEEHNA